MLEMGVVVTLSECINRAKAKVKVVTQVKMVATDKEGQKHYACGKVTEVVMLEVTPAGKHVFEVLDEGDDSLELGPCDGKKITGEPRIIEM
jgi:uncharacterized lipoprotein NlpE involved in copper resistance